ncbi:MAG: hypothetical protein IT337_13805 [Thermomicrobiales bacterium]|nr:hypothetical protein [Thermomicrobiales bacterium]
MSERQREREREARANALNDEVAGQGYEDTPGVDGHGIAGTVLDPNMGGQPVTVADVTPGATEEPYPGTADATKLRERHARNLEAAERFDAHQSSGGHRAVAGTADIGGDVEAPAEEGPRDMRGTPAPGSHAAPFLRPDERTIGNRPIRDSEGLLDIGGQTDHDVNIPLPEDGGGAAGGGDGA